MFTQIVVNFWHTVAIRTISNRLHCHAMVVW